MQITRQGRRTFDKMIKYLQGRLCDCTQASPEIDTFLSRSTMTEYHILKDSEGEAIAYLVQDEAILPRED